MRQLVARTLLGAITTLTLVATPMGVSAHHSSAMFDPSRTVTLRGVVKEFRWTNPHAALDVLVKSEQGPEEDWNIEMNSPEHLARAGWRPDTLQTGDAVSFVVHPARGAANSGQFMSGTGPRGPLIDGPPAPPISALTLSPTAAISSCPRVDLTLIESSASPDTRPVRLGKATVFVQRNAITTTRDISEIKLAGDDADTLIQIKYTEVAAARLLEATTDHDGLNLAFVVDDEVWLAFAWRGSHGIESGGTQVSIRNGLAKAQRLMESIRACSDARTE